jgi:5-deoxy-5-amino-3-dehydroquinate synthase
MRRVTIGVDPPYDVVVGAGALTQVGDLLAGRRRVAVVSQPAIAERYEATVVDALRAAGTEVLASSMPDGEAAKSLATVERLCSGWAAGGLLRNDAVVALGGGVVGDTAGFAAAVYHRGIAVVQCPTTLLGQVDSAIGGKTAVNLPEGKNLIGAVHQPIAVLADIGTLATLPERDYRSGLGEIAKYALMGGPDDRYGLAALIADHLDEITARDISVLTDLVSRCAAIKAAVVAADPFERTGTRATLNYGHTLAHALETAGGHDLHHGEAVAVGLVFAGALAGAMERVDPAYVDRHRELLVALGLPVAVPAGADADTLLTLMQRDKKAVGGLTFVLPVSRDGDVVLETVHDPDRRALDVAFAAVGVGS